VTRRKLKPADDRYFAQATLCYRLATPLNAPADLVWRSLTSDASIGAWPAPPGMRLHVRWTSQRPFGVGTTREVTLPTGLVLRERFFRWEEGSGYSFYAEESNRPGLHSLAEDYQIKADEQGTTLHWAVALEPTSRLVRYIGPAALFNGLSLRRTMAGTRRYFGAQPSQAQQASRGA
jgi:hypothetical protein